MKRKGTLEWLLHNKPPTPQLADGVLLENQSYIGVNRYNRWISSNKNS